MSPLALNPEITEEEAGERERERSWAFGAGSRAVMPKMGAKVSPSYRSVPDSGSNLVAKFEAPDHGTCFVTWGNP